MLVDGEPRADDVFRVRRRCRRRPHVRDTDKVTAAGVQPFGHRDPEHEVGERQVGEQLPLGDYRLQVIGGLAGQSGVLCQQVGKGRHGDYSITASKSPSWTTSPSFTTSLVRVPDDSVSTGISIFMD